MCYNLHQESGSIAVCIYLGQRAVHAHGLPTELDYLSYTLHSVVQRDLCHLDIPQNLMLVYYIDETTLIRAGKWE